MWFKLRLKKKGISRLHRSVQSLWLFGMGEAGSVVKAQSRRRDETAMEREDAVRRAPV